MAKQANPGGKSKFVESMVNTTLAQQQRAVTKEELDRVVEHLMTLIGVLQQQISGLDVALDLLVKKQGWTPEQLTEFMAAHKKGVQAFANKIVEQHKAKSQIIVA